MLTLKCCTALNILYHVCIISQSDDWCMDRVSNSTDEFCDLFEIYLGLYFAVWDLLDIGHGLAHSYPYDNNS